MKYAGDGQVGIGGWRFNVKLATYLVLLDVVGSGCGALSCRV